MQVTGGMVPLVSYIATGLMTQRIGYITASETTTRELASYINDILCWPESLILWLALMTTVEPLYCGHHWCHLKCPE